jgi:hypothetical protein
VAPGSDPAELDSAKHRYQVEYEQVCGIQNSRIPRSEFLEAYYWVSSPRSRLEIFSMRFSFPTTSFGSTPRLTCSISAGSDAERSASSLASC